MDAQKLSGKVALVTGAGSGIGAAAARLLAKEGARVGLLSRTEKQIAKVTDEIRKAGGIAMAIAGDVSSHSETVDAIKRLTDEWGQLDILFANAGVNGVWAPLEDITPEEWDKTLAINLRGTYLSVREALPWLKKQGGSVIINSSVNGNRMFSNTGATAYACSKAGQVAFAKMMAVELGEHHIRVNVICPGAIGTEIDDNTEKRHTEGLGVAVDFPEGQIPLTGKTPGSAEQVAKLVLFLASDDSGHITGTEIYIDGAQSLLQG